MMNDSVEQGEKPLPNATNRIVAIFDTPDSAEMAARLLEGFASAKDVDVTCGVQGAEAVDVDGTNHGVLGRILRATHRLTDGTEMERIDQELRAGRCVVSFRPEVMKDVEPAARLLESCGGRYIHHFGAAVVTMLRE
ncbi:MAG: hypothetical protein QM736_29920 [Vicinamibacterales bacterium]